MRISSTTMDIKQFVKQVIHVSDIIKFHFSFFCPNSLLIMSSWAIAYNIKNIRNAMQESICVHWFIPSSLLFYFQLEILWILLCPFGTKLMSIQICTKVRVAFIEICSFFNPSLRLMILITLWNDRSTHVDSHSCVKLDFSVFIDFSLLWN